jgi:hypothetical protein
MCRTMRNGKGSQQRKRVAGKAATRSDPPCVALSECE